MNRAPSGNGQPGVRSTHIITATVAAGLYSAPVTAFTSCVSEQVGGHHNPVCVVGFFTGENNQCLSRRLLLLEGSDLQWPVELPGHFLAQGCGVCRIRGATAGEQSAVHLGSKSATLN
jgi:hypothetical protein